MDIAFFQFGFYLFAGLAALLHVYIWTMESLTWRKPATWKRFGVASQEDAETQALFAFNQGFYNLFLALTAGAGVVLFWWPVVSHTLLIVGLGSMVLAALVLITNDRRMARAALVQGMFPALALAFLGASALS